MSDSGTTNADLGSAARPTPAPGPFDVVRASVEAYLAQDRAAIEKLLAEDCTFTARTTTRRCPRAASDP